MAAAIITENKSTAITSRIKYNIATPKTIANARSNVSVVMLMSKWDPGTFKLKF